MDINRRKKNPTDGTTRQNYRRRQRSIDDIMKSMTRSNDISLPYYTYKTISISNCGMADTLGKLSRKAEERHER